MKIVRASITTHFDYSESIQGMQDDREREGLPPMTDEEIREYVRDDLAGTDFNCLAPEPQITIEDDDS